MSRLTKKIENPQYSNDYEMLCTFDYHLINKLGKLEDIEEQLGCPLDVVFKAIEDGIVIKGDINQYGAKTLWLDNKPLEALVGEKLDFEEPRLIKYNDWCFSCNGGSYRGCVKLKDYKKTWWLSKTKEE